MPDLVVIGVSSKGIEWVSEELKKFQRMENYQNY